MSQVVVYDATHANIGHLPPGHAAGYTTGTPDIQWTAADWAAHPGAVRIAQSPLLNLDEQTDADVLDVENLAATLEDCAPWAKAARASFDAGTRPGQREPMIYMSASMVSSVTGALKTGGITAGVTLWVANWNLDDPQAVADVNNSKGPFEIAAIQWHSLQYYDVSTFEADWLANVSAAPVTPPPGAAEQITVTMPLLNLGDKGPPVERLQALINVYLGLHGLRRLHVDGQFGPKTLAHVREVQQKAGLQVSGQAGRHTWAVLITGKNLP